MKLDMRKACDTIEWYFLEEMLHALKFPNQIIRTVMTSVATLKFTLMVN